MIAFMLPTDIGLRQGRAFAKLQGERERLNFVLIWTRSGNNPKSNQRELNRLECHFTALD